jgi:hypothetical protein
MSSHDVPRGCDRESGIVSLGGTDPFADRVPKRLLQP